MGGRDPHEAHRVATPLELLFDLTFATSFSLAAAQLAHALAEGHHAAAFLGFGFASFAICWAWINFSWFSSAYDTGDWMFRVATMVQSNSYQRGTFVGHPGVEYGMARTLNAC